MDSLSRIEVAFLMAAYARAAMNLYSANVARDVCARLRRLGYLEENRFQITPSGVAALKALADE